MVSDISYSIHVIHRPTDRRSGGSTLVDDLRVQVLITLWLSTHGGFNGDFSGELSIATFDSWRLPIPMNQLSSQKIVQSWKLRVTTLFFTKYMSEVMLQRLEKDHPSKKATIF